MISFLQVIHSRYCDREPEIPAPSLYFIYGEAKEIHMKISHGEGGGSGPGDGSAPMTKADVTKRIEEAMKNHEPFTRQESSHEFEEFLDEWGDRPTDNCAFVVASDPLTFDKIWHPIPSHSILWCTKGQLPGMRYLKEDC